MRELENGLLVFSAESPFLCPPVLLEIRLIKLSTLLQDRYARRLLASRKGVQDCELEWNVLASRYRKAAS